MEGEGEGVFVEEGVRTEQQQSPVPGHAILEGLSRCRARAV